MNMPVSNNSHPGTNPGSSHRRWLVILGILVLAAGGYSVYLGTQTQDLRRQFATARQDNAALREKLSDTDTALQNALDSLRQDISQAREDAGASLAKAQSAANRLSSCSRAACLSACMGGWRNLLTSPRVSASTAAICSSLKLLSRAWKRCSSA